MRILIADDHSVVRQGVSLILRDTFDDIKIGQADSFYETLTLLKDSAFDLLLLDINLPGGNHPAMIDDIKNMQDDIKILMFSAYEEEHYAMRYLQAGAHGFINKLSAEDKIIEAVNTVLNNEIYIGDGLKTILSSGTTGDNPKDLLSKREFEIGKLLVKGEGNLEIANRLNIRMSTVSTYKTRIFEKLGVTNVVTLAEKYRLYDV